MSAISDYLRRVQDGVPSETTYQQQKSLKLGCLVSTWSIFSVNQLLFCFTLRSRIQNILRFIRTDGKGRGFRVASVDIGEIKTLVQICPHLFVS